MYGIEKYIIDMAFANETVPIQKILPINPLVYSPQTMKPPGAVYGGLQ